MTKTYVQKSQLYINQASQLKYFLLTSSKLRFYDLKYLSPGQSLLTSNSLRNHCISKLFVANEKSKVWERTVLDFRLDMLRFPDISFLTEFCPIFYVKRP